MKNIRLFIFSSVFIVLSIVSQSCPVFSASESHHQFSVEPAKILILLSYHQTHSWTADILTGVKDELTTADRPSELYVEFMDTKRHIPEQVFPRLEELYRTKYRDSGLDLIIVADNNALDFLLPRRALLFPDVPVVFCGINNYTPSLIAGLKQITGVAEATDFVGTIELALNLQPATRHVAVICDNTPTGIAQRKDLQNILPAFSNRVQFIELFNLTRDELIHSLKNLPEQSVVVMLSFYRDRDGKQLSVPEQALFITKNCNFPVYTAWDMSLGYGTIGGIMTTGRSQGMAAGQLAVRILAGESADQIAVVTKSPNVPMLDYMVMRHFGLSIAKIPAGSVLMNKPKSFYHTHRRVIWISMLVFLGQTLIITVLIINVRKRRRAEQRLLKQSEHLQDIVNKRTRVISEKNKELSRGMEERDLALVRERNLTEIIEKSLNEIYLFKEDDYQFVFVNRGARVNTGYSLDELMEMTPLDIKPEMDAASFAQEIIPLKNGEKESVTFETYHRRKNGTIYPVEVHLQKTEYNSAPVFAAVILDITQRHRMAQRYEELVEGTDALVIQMDSEAKLLYANRKAGEITGLPLEQLIGQDAFAFLHPDDHQRVASWFENAISQQILQDRIENRVVNQQTGAVYDMLWTGNFHYGEQGQLISHNAIGYDITQRKKNEEAIRKSEEQWDRTFDAFPDIVTLQDTDLHIVKANQAACDILALPCDAIAGQPCHELFHGSSEPCRNCPLLETKGDFSSYSREIYHEKLGKTFLVSAASVLDEQGQIEYIVHVAKDISEVKEFEQERLRLSAAIEQAAETVVITDDKGTIQYVNPAFEKLTGYSRREALGKNPRILKSGKHDQGFYKKMWTTLLRGETWRGNLINRKKDGSLFEEEASISPVKNSAGHITNFVAVKRDVSKEVALENQLRHSIKMEAVGTMASGIAHDFNNILSGIIGCGEFIQDEVTPESEIGQNVAEILAAGKRAADLVRQILTFSRQENSKKELFSPSQLVHESLRMLRATMPATVTIEDDIDPDCGMLLADPTSIHQIVINLCTNGMQALPEQKGLLRVSLQRQETGKGEKVSSGPYIVLSVMDTGCGMDQATIGRIFEPYFTTKEMGRGTGLGLAIVHGVVEKYHGFIEVKSDIGKGTVFSVFLPLAEKNDLQLPVAQEKERIAVRDGGARILVVDDEMLLVKINEKRLTDSGYTVTAFSDSREALAFFSRSPESIDLLITDQTMPQLTGAELAQEVLAIKPSLPIIMCTGHSDVVSKEDALKLGIQKYVFKPLQGDELLDAVRDILAETV